MDLTEKYLGEKKKKPMKKSKCCGGKVVFNNATGDNVCSVCRNPVGNNTYMSEKVDEAMTMKKHIALFRDVEPSDSAMDAVVLFTKKYDKKLSNEIDSFFNSYIKKLDSFERKLDKIIHGK